MAWRSMIPAHIRWSPRVAGESDRGADLSGAALFSLIWEAIADLLGTATTAVLVRRAVRRGIGASPELAELEISVRALEYHCAVPASWGEAGATPLGLKTLVGELVPLLLELTGPIVVRRLERIPELRGRGLLAPAPEERKEK